MQDLATAAQVISETPDWATLFDMHTHVAPALEEWPQTCGR